MKKRDQAFAKAKASEGDPWYTNDQLETELYGVYRLSIQLRFNYVMEWLHTLRIDGKTVLDLGCGDGQWSLLIKGHFDCKLIGVDYNELRLQRYLKNVRGAEAKLGTCYEIPLEASSVDIVLFNQVLEHLEEPAQALLEIRRVMKPDCVLILSVPNEGTWLKQKVQYQYIEPSALKTTDHIQFFTKESLQRVLEATGFHVRQLDLIGFYFPHNGISRRLVSRKWVYTMGLATARLFPVLHDCLFAVCDISVPDSRRD